MLAIHNPHTHKVKRSCAANAFAKLSKCQQFTTSMYADFFRCRCKRFCKVIKMLAIHNHYKDGVFQGNAANAFAKLSKCQQFTTYYHQNNNYQVLQTLLQSYQNVSNSQHYQQVFHNFDAANAFAKLSKCQQFTTGMKEIIGMNKL